MGRSGKEEEIEDLSGQEVDPRIEAKVGTHEYSFLYTNTKLSALESIPWSSNQPSIIFPHA